ncbi:MAG: antibiotic biosynthesis monooxygenase family protein [Acidimicrobiales bacterium]
MAYVRMFVTALDPADVAAVRDVVLSEVKPVFESQTACSSVELLVSTEQNAGGLVDGCILSRWDSLDDLRQAVSSPAILAVVDKLRPQLRQEPIGRIYEIVG